MDTPRENRFETSLLSSKAQKSVSVTKLTNLLVTYVQSKLALDSQHSETASSHSPQSFYFTCRSRSPQPASFLEDSPYHKSISEQSFSHLSAKSTVFLTVPSSPSMRVSLSEEEAQAIEVGFMSLVSKLEGTEGVRKGPVVHVENVRQYFLSAYAITEQILDTLMEPLKCMDWVAFPKFKRAVERVYLLDRLLGNFANTHNKWKLNLLIFKLLCTFQTVFFKLVSFNDTLHQSELTLVFTLAGKTQNVDVSITVNRIIAKTKAQRGFPCDVLTLQELFYALTTCLFPLSLINSDLNSQFASLSP